MSSPESIRDQQLKLRADAIVAAASELLAKHGYADLNMNDLATKLAISKATLYHHFPSKDALVAEVVARGMRRSEAALADLGPDASPLARIEHMVRVGLTGRLRHAVSHGAVLPKSVRDEPPLKRQHRHVTDMLAQLVDQARAQGEVAAHLETAVIVRMIHAVFEIDFSDLQREKRLTPETLADHLVSILVDGIRTRPSVAPVAPGPKPRRPKKTTALIALLAGGLVALAHTKAHAEAPTDPAGVPAAASSAPSLDALLAAARGHATDVRRAQALANHADTQRDLEAAALWPSLSASLAYTHNQNASVVRIPTGTTTFDEATIVAPDQVDFVVRLQVPVLDLAQWGRLGSAKKASAAAVAAVDTRISQVELAVVRAYAQLAGNAALARAAEVAEAAARSSREVTATRVAAGLTDDAALPRADAAIARARQAAADAALGVANARRVLTTLTGLTISAEAPPLAPELDAPAPLGTWLADVERLPAVRAATLRLEAARQGADAEWLGYVPRLDATISERVTNANGFGDAANWSAGLTATWNLDRRTWARADERAASATMAELDLAAAREDAASAITDAWQAIDAHRARASAAAAQAAAEAKARDVVKVRFAAGQGTPQLVIDADRDAFQAEIGHVQALADLFLARAELRILAGMAGAKLAPTAGGAP